MIDCHIPMTTILIMYAHYWKKFDNFERHKSAVSLRTQSIFTSSFRWLKLRGSLLYTKKPEHLNVSKNNSFPPIHSQPHLKVGKILYYIKMVVQFYTALFSQTRYRKQVTILYTMTIYKSVRCLHLFENCNIKIEFGLFFFPKLLGQWELNNC